MILNPFRYFFGPIFSRIIMTAQYRKEKEKYADKRVLTQLDGAYIKQSFLDSTGDAKLNMVEFSSEKNPDITQKKIIVFLMGRSGVYEDFYDYFAQMAQKYPNYHIVGFNFRNVLKSTGKVYCEQDWIDDAKAIINHFRERGCRTENILMSGHSLGGAIATRTAAQIYAEDKKTAEDPSAIVSVGLINNRSFSNLPEEIMRAFISDTKRGLTNGVIYGLLTALVISMTMPLLGLAGLSMIKGALFSGMIVGGISFLHENIGCHLLRPWLTGLLDLTLGRMDAYHDYLSLPPKRREYLTARKDAIIPKAASLHHALRPLRKEQERVFSKNWKAIKSQPYTNAFNEFKEAVINFRDRKLRHFIAPNDGLTAHVDRIGSLTSYHTVRRQFDEPEEDGQTILEKKVDRILRFDSRF